MTSIARGRILSSCRALVLLALSLAAAAQDDVPLSSPNLDVSVNGSVAAMVRLSDGSVVVGGSFSSVFDLATQATYDRQNLARFKSDGALDGDWNPGVGGQVYALAADASDSIYVGGSFFYVGNETRNNLARVSSAGEVDLNWYPVPDSTVYALTVDSATGAIFAGGEFITIGGLLRSRIAKLSPTGWGQGDPSWNQAANGPVRALAINGAALYAGGDFTSIGAQPRSFLAKLSTSGTGAVDATWNPAANSTVDAIAIGAGGVVYAGGGFTFVGGRTRSYFAKLAGTGTGSADATWNPAPNNAVYAVATDASGAVYAGGEFSLIGGLSRTGVAKLSGATTGAGDVTWNAAVDDSVSALVVDPGGQLFIGGDFKSVGGLSDLSAARVSLATGDLTLDWFVQGDASVTAVASAADGSLFVAGAFSRVAVGGVNAVRKNLLKLKPNGDLDASWNPAPDGPLSALARDGSGALYVAGSFQSVGGQLRQYLAKLSEAGTGLADATWNPAPDSLVYTLATGTGGAVYVGGFFSAIGGQSFKGIAKLAGTGAGLADGAWNPGANGFVFGITPDGHGALFVRGNFSTIGGQTRSYLAKLSATGSGQADASWNPAPDGSIEALALDASGAAFVAGGFGSIGGQMRSGLAKLSGTGAGSADPQWNPSASGVYALATDTSGAVYAGGVFSQIGGVSRYCLAKLAGSGAGVVDPNWNPAPDNSVSGLGTGVDGTLYVMGFFNSIGGQTRSRLAAFRSSKVFDDSFE